MNSPAPYQLVAVLTFVASIALLFVYVRARLGPGSHSPRSSRSSSWARPGTTCSSRTR